MIAGETTHAMTLQCPGCGKTLNLKVCLSSAGHYLGFACDTCGPISRETSYFKTRAQAEKALNNPQKHWRT